MDGRRKRRTSSADEGLALVKAAAWAWYQHGSGNEGIRAARESDLARPAFTPLQPRPSRFKLEAAAAASEVAGGALLAGGASPTLRSRALGSPARTDNFLHGRYCMVEKVAGHLGGGRLHGVPRVVAGGGRGGRKQQGFWVRHAVGFCGSGADVADARALVGGRRPQLRLWP